MLDVFGLPWHGMELVPKPPSFSIMCSSLAIMILRTTMSTHVAPTDAERDGRVARSVGVPGGTYQLTNSPTNELTN